MANWGKITSRGNVEDRRSAIPAIGGGLGLGGVALYIIFNLLTGGNAGDILSQIQNIPNENQTTNNNVFEGQDDYEVFASTVLGSNNDAWKSTFEKRGNNYTEPKLVLFRAATESLCGTATSEVGPHYCPFDRTVYLDETFFDELTNRFGAKGGDVAQAYVISHEVGHHVQNLLGLLNEKTSDRESENEISIKTELQADCFAGLWAASIKNKEILEPGEIKEALDAAAAVGDDIIQKKVAGYINPENWTHGSSAQRVTAFEKGYETGNFSECEF